MPQVLALSIGLGGAGIPAAQLLVSGSVPDDAQTSKATATRLQRLSLTILDAAASAPCETPP